MVRAKARFRGKDEVVLKRVVDEEILNGLDWKSEEPEVLRDVLMKAGVWLPSSSYGSWPVMLPWAVRDLASRPTGHAQGLDEWGAPNSSGYFRDDNSMVKGLIRGLQIQGPVGSPYQGRALGTGFVAAHIWRFTGDAGQFTSRDPDLYSFVPNIVWLPKALAKRSDKEGGVVQRTLQELSVALFRRTPVLLKHSGIVESCWVRLLAGAQPVTSVEHVEANRFVDVERFSVARRRSASAVRDGIDEVLSLGAPLRKVISTRYTAGLPGVDHRRLQELRARLSHFL